MRKLQIGLVAAGVILASIQSQAQTSLTVDPTASWQGYMNVFNLPSAGGGYQFGSSWGTADLTATFAGSVLTLGPNQIGDPATYWYIGGGGPGAVGNKVMDANMYVQNDGGFAGQNITFSGNVLSATLGTVVAPNGVSWTSVAFIKDFAPDFSSSVTVTAPVTSAGLFSISLNTINDPARHVQYGFETIGSDVWSTDVAPFGNIQIAPVPEPSTMALMGLGSLALVALRRKNSK